MGGVDPHVLRSADAATAKSRLAVTLTLSASQAFHLSGRLSGITSVNASALASVAIRDSGIATIFSREAGYNVPRNEIPIDELLLLEPGTYQLVAEATALSWTALVDAFYTVTLTPVPEPTTGSLMMWASIVSGAFIRRHKGSGGGCETPSRGRALARRARRPRIRARSQRLPCVDRR